MREGCSALDFPRVSEAEVQYWRVMRLGSVRQPGWQMLSGSKGVTKSGNDLGASSKVLSCPACDGPRIIAPAWRFGKPWSRLPAYSYGRIRGRIVVY